MTTPNASQRRLIDSIDGTYVVDAGAGTGKTFAITRRYANILQQDDVEPDDILLLTFTRNAAAEMKDRVVERTEYDLTRLQDAPISTFHAYCYRLLRRYGHTTPHHLGIDDVVPRSLDLVEDEVRENALFREFFSRFEDRHPEHETLFALISNPLPLRSLVAELAAKGVIPTQNGWYRNTGSVLDGDREAFFETFEEANTPGEGANGPTQSAARDGITSRLDADMAPYPPSAPTYGDIDEYPRANRAVVEQAFDENRAQLEQFVHDLYVEYLEFALSRNYLTYGLMLALAFVMLCEDEVVRESVGHEYVMIDEFQDTNELQFKVALLLAAAPNFCVVGDWKQSIYGFQYTAVENILEFEERLGRFADELNTDSQRVAFNDVDVTKFSLEKNYRSTQSILNCSRQSLTIEATRSEDLDVETVRLRFTDLEPTNYVDNSCIEAYTHEDEIDVILDRIQHIVGNPSYAVERSDEPRPPDDASDAEKRAAESERLAPPSYEDIAIFTRTRSFARELLERASEFDIPIAYEGGVELFDTDQAKLLLAWLRICEADEDRGWAVVLEEAGHTLPQTRSILAEESYPTEMVSFRETLQETETLGSLAHTVFDRYGYQEAYADALVAELTQLHDSTIRCREEAIEFLEANLKAGATPEVDANPGGDAVTLQTIHSAKGLEYPIVILGNLNQQQFPHYGVPSRSVVRYDDTLGLRQTKVHDESTGQSHLFKNWRFDVLSGAMPSSYDEERRLLYVAMTRAKRHLLFTAGETPSNFFTELSTDPIDIDPVVEAVTEPDGEPTTLEVSMPDPDLPVRAGVHDIMDDTIYEAVTEGRGKEFGQELHDFAEAYAFGEPVSPDGEEQRGVAGLIDSLDGSLYPEQTVLCPLDGDPRIVLTGIIDLLHVDDERVDIIDYKTDLERIAADEYQTQLSVYWHVLQEVYPDHEIRAAIYWTADGELEEISPEPSDALREVAERRLSRV